MEPFPTDIRQALINCGGGHIIRTTFHRELLSPEKQKNQLEVIATINEAFGSLRAFKAFTTATTTRLVRDR